MRDVKKFKSIEELVEWNDKVIDESFFETINRWLDRGDGAAVYQNVDLSSLALGHCTIMSYGSSIAQIEEPEPPSRMPDIRGRQPGWRYYLLATIKR